MSLKRLAAWPPRAKARPQPNSRWGVPSTSRRTTDSAGADPVRTPVPSPDTLRVRQRVLQDHTRRAQACA